MTGRERATGGGRRRVIAAVALTGLSLLGTVVIVAAQAPGGPLPGVTLVTFGALVT